MNEDYLEHFGVKGMKWGVRNSSRSERKVKVANAKEAHKQSIAKADAAWNREFAKVKKNNPNANYGDLVNKALSAPAVKKTQSEAYNARLAVKKSAQREKKTKLSSSTDIKSERGLNETETGRLMIGVLGSLIATPGFGAGVYGATKYQNRKNTKQAVADILGSDISSYSKSSLKRARKTLNKYGNVEIQTKKGTASLNYDGAGTRAYQTGKPQKPTAAAQRQVAQIPKEFKPRIMPDGRSIEITGIETGKKEVWKTY